MLRLEYVSKLTSCKTYHTWPKNFRIFHDMVDCLVFGIDDCIVFNVLLMAL